MKRAALKANGHFIQGWKRIGPRFMPFADAATTELPMGRLLRLSLFQVSVGMAAVLLIGTLNRVMIVELGVPAWLVSLMVALPLVAAPFRALIGFRSDTHTSVLGWRRVPYIWMGTLVQFGGLAIMPFALILLSGDSHGSPIIGQAGAALSFLMLGAGLHTVQTAGLALATDLAPPQAHPRVVALLCMMLLVGMVSAALLFGWVLTPFSEIRLIQVLQGTAVVTMLLNGLALWQQEPRNPARTARGLAHPSFAQAWRDFSAGGQAIRRLVALGLGTISFSMQDVLLEPYGGQVLHLTVGQTTALTALLAGGGLCGFGLAARQLGRGADPYRFAAIGTMVGLVAFTAVIFSAPLGATPLFAVGVTLIGFGAGLFGHSTLTAAMGMARPGQIGMALGVWGAVQASAAGGAIALGGLIRDGVGALAARGALGPALAGPATGYSVVYHIEIYLLFATLIALGPLVRGTLVSGTAAGSAARDASNPSVWRGNPMQIGAITGYIDVAQVTLYAFFVFFAGLIFYLRREDKREGYPLESERSGRIVVQGFPRIPSPKVFRLAGGHTVLAPRPEAPQPMPHGVVSGGWLGAPLVPTGNPMVDGVGPASYVDRAEVPDAMFDGPPKLVPLRVAAGYSLAEEDPDPRGMAVYGADGVVAGSIADAWIDRAEMVVRYLEVATTFGTGVAHHVLVPMTLVRIDRARRMVNVASVMGAQFAEAPVLANPDQITMREEDRVSAYFGGGHMYATPARGGPLL